MNESFATIADRLVPHALDPKYAWHCAVCDRLLAGTVPCVIVYMRARKSTRRWKRAKSLRHVDLPSTIDATCGAAHAQVFLTLRALEIADGV